MILTPLRFNLTFKGVLAFGYTFSLVILFLSSTALAKSSPTETHMLTLSCANGSDYNTKSRLSVLEVEQDKKTDFAIVTGHSLPLKKPCIVRDFEGRIRSVALIDYAENFSTGTQNDWAVISFPKINTKGLVRYPLTPITNVIPDLHLSEINFATARGLPSNSQSCHLIETNRYSDPHLRLLHNCHAIRGQSGSPLTKFVGNKVFLVGIHVGRAWFFQAPYSGKAEFLGYIALFDQHMVEEIQGIIKDTSL